MSVTATLHVAKNSQAITKKSYNQRKKAEASKQQTPQHKIDQHLRVHRSRIHHSKNFPRRLGHLKKPKLPCQIVQGSVRRLLSVLRGNSILEYNVKPVQAGTLKLFLRSEQKWLLEFLDRPDISYTTPGRNDHCYVGKVEGQR